MIKKAYYQKLSDIAGDSNVDTAKLREMAAMAKDYLKSFSWCPPINNIYLAYGVGGIVAVFLVDFPWKIQGTDDELWVIIGDLPSAYLVVEPMDDEAHALERYCDLMDQWIAAVRNSDDLSGVFPVSVEPTVKHAEMLYNRIEFLRTEIIPRMGE
ncbi:MAG TPA: hypothetical protein VFL78_09395 [Rhodanobacteraceae bacterium]|nr:hypothetical protein [Rhodanobacteraceae bacterium]